MGNSVAVASEPLSVAALLERQPAALPAPSRAVYTATVHAWECKVSGCRVCAFSSFCSVRAVAVSVARSTAGRLLVLRGVRYEQTAFRGRQRHGFVRHGFVRVQMSRPSVRGEAARGRRVRSWPR